MKDGKKALTIGATAISIYIVNYYLRNILSVLTPTMLTCGFTVEQIARLSSTYMLLYACGQLVNGFLGDIFSPKKIACLGLLISGGAMIVFPFMAYEFMQICCFAFLGFGLSMMRGPLMKIISENTKVNYARVIGVFFSFASFAGPLIASLFALINGWKNVFLIAGIVAIILVIIGYFILTVLEKKGYLTYIKNQVKNVSSIFEVFKIEGFVFYIVIACLVEICVIAINQWITTFLTNALNFSNETSNMIFTIIATLRAFMPFVALLIFKAVKERDVAMMRVTFSISAIMFALLLVSKNEWVSVVFLCLALMSFSCTSALLWSIYIPSLGKTGKVSTVNGVLDGIGYVTAAICNLVFASVMTNVGWNTVYVLWASLGVIGVLVTFIFKRNKKSSENN